MCANHVTTTVKTKFVKIRLQSTEWINTPALVRWCQVGWRTSIAQGASTEPFLKAMAAYGLPDDLAKKLIANRIPHRIDGNTVVVEVKPKDAMRIRKVS